MSSDEVIELDLTIAYPKTASIGSSVPAAVRAAIRASVCLFVSPYTPAGNDSPGLGHGTIERLTTAAALSLMLITKKLHELLSGTPLNEKAIFPSPSAVAVDPVAVSDPSELTFSIDIVYASPDVNAAAFAPVNANIASTRTPKRLNR
jgi:hypothetical protein